MIPALVIGPAIASGAHNLVPAVIVLAAVGILLASHPARGEFLERGGGAESKKDSRIHHDPVCYTTGPSGVFGVTGGRPR